MRHLDALHAHIEQPQDKRRVKPRGAHDRGDADMLGRHHHRLHIVQVEAGVLHIDKGGVKAGEPDDLDNLRIGDAADMRAERQAALAQDAFYAIFSHDLLPCPQAILKRDVAKWVWVRRRAPRVSAAAAR